MKISKGGVNLDQILALDGEDFAEAIESAAELEKEIAAAIR